VGIAIESGIAERTRNLFRRGSNRSFAIGRALVRSPAPAPACLRAFRLSNAHDVYSRLTDAAIEKLATLRWPGNIRELRNALQRALVRRRMALIDEGSFDESFGGQKTAPVRLAVPRRSTRRADRIGSDAGRLTPKSA